MSVSVAVSREICGVRVYGGGDTVEDIWVRIWTSEGCRGKSRPEVVPVTGMPLFGASP